MYPTLHKGIAGTRWFTELPHDFRIATIEDFYSFGNLRTDLPFLLVNKQGEYEAYRTKLDTWENFLPCVETLIPQKKVYIYESL